MNQEDFRLLNELREMLVESNVDRYAGLGDRARMLQLVQDVYEDRTDLPELRGVLDLFILGILLAYRGVKARDPQLAATLFHSWMQDVPGAPNSRLLERWRTLVEASHALKSTTTSQNVVSTWVAAKAVTLASAEFLSGLLGFLIICWQVANGHPWKPSTLGKTLNEKLDLFEQLTGGEDGAFFVYFRLIDRPVRNAIAHSDLTLDRARAEVILGERINGTRTERRVSLVHFMGLAMVGSHLPHAYLAALSTIALVEDGNSVESLALPVHLKRTLLTPARPGNTIKPAP
ncbi:hypothetical protein V3W47_08635 [Deinococcus sp. YIM 134068]|uniref:hypothetical protein n=1 Tax=Deinococcus lichenicola TaxID=3118910 RepID=UPI002F91D645